MATAALTGNVTAVCNTPFLIKKFTYTGGATASLDITHGEAVAPDTAWGYATTDSSPSGSPGVKAGTTAATQIKIFTSLDAAGAGVLFLAWFNQPGSGGLNPPA